MYAVIFEVEIKLEGKEEYLQLAADLRNELDHMDGFISVERFQSLVNEGKLVSLSFWESEKAISNWRNNINHKIAQKKYEKLGRPEDFEELIEPTKQSQDHIIAKFAKYGIEAMVGG